MEDDDIEAESEVCPCCEDQRYDSDDKECPCCGGTGRIYTDSVRETENY